MYKCFTIPDVATSSCSFLFCSLLYTWQCLLEASPSLSSFWFKTCYAMLRSSISSSLSFWFYSKWQWFLATWLLFFLLVLNDHAFWQNFLLFLLLVLNGIASKQHFLLFFLLSLNDNAFWQRFSSPSFFLCQMAMLPGSIFSSSSFLFLIAMLPSSVSSSYSFLC